MSRHKKKKPQARPRPSIDHDSRSVPMEVLLEQGPDYPPASAFGDEAGPTVVPLLLTVTEVCALLKISRSTLIRLENAGTLPGRVKLGGQVRYHREVVEKWLLQQAGA